MKHNLSKFAPWTIGFTLLLITAAVFWEVPKGQFVRWDDDIKIYRNEHLGAFSRENVVWMLTDTHRLLYYAPVSWLSLSLIWQFCRLDPFGYHLASLLLHCGNALLIFVLIHQILRRIYSVTNELENLRAWIAAGVAALLWSVHPLRVEAVAWATAISHLLASFFVLLSFLIYLRFRESQSERCYVLYASSLGLFGAAMLSYPVVLAFPVILIITDLFFVARMNPGQPRPFSKSLCFQWLPFIVISFAALAITLYGRSHATQFWSAPVSMTDFNFLQRLAQALYVWTYYLWKPLAPFHLSPVDLNLSEVNPTAPRFIFAALFICAVTLLLWLKRRQVGGLFALWFCYLVLLVPMLGLTEYPHYTSDRYSYLPAMIQSIVVAGLLFTVWKTPFAKCIAMSAVLFAICACAHLSVQQARVWHDSRALFRHILSFLGETPAAGVLHTRLGLVLVDAGELDTALAEFQTAVRRYPEHGQAHAGLGRALGLKGKINDALLAYDKAVALDAYDAQTQFERALLLTQQRRIAEAIAGYTAGLRSEPHNVEALNNLAWILGTDADQKNRNGSEAVKLALQACQITRFERPALIGTLAAAYAEAGKFDLAIQTGQKARDLALASGNKSIAARNEELLVLYKSGKPYREQ